MSNCPSIWYLTVLFVLGILKYHPIYLGGDAEIEGLANSPEMLAARIEDIIFKNNKSDTGMKYKNQVRSRVFNLKDKKNPALRVNVLMGLIPPEKIAVMTAEEMASDEVQINITVKHHFPDMIFNPSIILLTIWQCGSLVSAEEYAYGGGQRGNGRSQAGHQGGY